VRFLFIYLFSVCFFCVNAQLKLGKNIGLNHVPADSDTIQQSLNVNHKGDEPGPKKGSPVPAFKLYGLKNECLDIAQELKKGKPVLLINASYSCHYFRNTIPFFDSIALAYPNISFFIIYTIEAHPGFPFTCHYTNETTALKFNYYENIRYWNWD